MGSEAFIVYSIITFTGAWLLPFIVQSPDDEPYTQRPPQSLLTTWMCGHAMFAAAMFWAPFATSFRFATVLVCLCGL